jgi:hypothetical protein
MYTLFENFNMLAAASIAGEGTSTPTHAKAARFGDPGPAVHKCSKPTPKWDPMGYPGRGAIAKIAEIAKIG